MENSGTSKTIKTIVFAIISFALIAGNFVLEGNAERGDIATDVQKISSLDFAQDNEVFPRGVLRFMNEDSKAQVRQTGDEDSYIFSLNSGRIWGNFSISTAKVNILLGKIVVIPNMAQFDLNFDGQKLVLDVYGGDVYLGFLADGVEVSQYVDQYDPIFINTLLVPKDSRVNIPVSKIDNRVGEILHSKLVKEFQYSAIPSEEKNAEWVTSNLSKDLKYAEQERQNYIAQTFKIGLIGSDGVMSDLLFLAEENLTFMPERKREIVLNHLFSYLSDAIYEANKGNNEKSDEMLLAYKDYLTSLPEEFKNDGMYLSKVDQYVNDLLIFPYESTQNNILNVLMENKFAMRSEQIRVVNLSWLNVYDAMRQGKSEAEAALDTYYKYFDATAKDETLEDERYVQYVTYQNELFDNLFLRFAVFYKDGYFAIKSAMEKELLSVYEEGQAREELKQTLISNKFNFLKRIIKSFFRDEMEVDEAKAILSRLIGEIRDLLPADSSGVAVIQLFESQLNDIAYVWGYLNSPEYYTSKTYGETHDERYQSYLKERDRIWSFIDIQEDVLGEKLVSETKIADIEKAIKGIFEENEDLTEVSLSEIKDVGQRYVKVTGVIGGFPFEAKYDRDYESLGEVYAYGELVSDSPVKLDNLLELLQKKFSNVSDEKKQQYALVNEETNAQRIARKYIADLVAEAGFEVTEEQVVVVDAENAVYRVEKVTLEDVPEVLVTFDYRPSTEKAENVVLFVDSNTVVMDGNYNMEDLPDLVKSGAQQGASTKVKR